MIFSFFLPFFIGFVTTSPVMKKNISKFSSGPKCCHSSREYPLNSLQKVEEMPTQQHCRALHKHLNWAANQEEQSRLQGIPPAFVKIRESCRSHPWLFSALWVLSQWKRRSSDATVLWNAQQRDSPTFFPAVRKSFCFSQRAEPHLAYFKCWNLLLHNKTLSYRAN